MSNTITLRMRNNLSELMELMEAAERFLETGSSASGVLYGVKLVLEEILTNVIKYGHDDGLEHEIIVILNVDAGRVTVECFDDGREFNPLAAPAPQLPDSILDCTPGGLGIHLVKQTVDTISYRREGGRNVLTMVMGLGGKDGRMVS
jgi:serine/threonine-protein kinase RsbW